MEAQIDRVIAKVRREAAAAAKLARFRLKNDADVEQTILFVVGCQRSGTSMTSQIFKRDPNAFVFNELSVLSSGDKVESLRFDPLDQVAAKISKTRAPLVIAKPLVESHRIADLSEAFPNARFLWLYRDYRGVAKSNINRWGSSNGHSDLQPIINSDRTNWRSVGMSEETIALVKELNHSGMSDEDAACMFWYCRNSLFFDQNLAENPRVLPVNYKALVSEPELAIARIYAFAGLPTPAVDMSSFISRASVGRGADLDLSDRVRALCDETFERLESTGS